MFPVYGVTYLPGCSHRGRLSTRQLRHAATLDKANDRAACDESDGENCRKHYG
jgi:hypothetical protein